MTQSRDHAVLGFGDPNELATDHGPTRVLKVTLKDLLEVDIERKVGEFCRCVSGYTGRNHVGKDLERSGG